MSSWCYWFIMLIFSTWSLSSYVSMLKKYFLLFYSLTTFASVMLKALRILVFLLLLTTLGFFYGIIHRQNILSYMSFISEGNIFNGFSTFMLMNKPFNPIHGWSNNTNVSGTKASSIQDFFLLETINTPSSTTVNIALRSPSEVLKEGDGIIFLETSDRLQPPPLVLCAVESAARVYKNQPVAFFMKGLNNTNIEQMVKEHFPMLLSLNNIYFFPLRMEDMFTDTPLLSWYMKVKCIKIQFLLIVMYQMQPNVKQHFLPVGAALVVCNLCRYTRCIRHLFLRGSVVPQKIGTNEYYDT